MLINSFVFGNPAADYDPVAELGTDLLVYLDAEEITGSDGDTLTTIQNLGTENDYSTIAGTVQLSVESGTKAIQILSGGRLQGASTTPALSSWTFYALVKSGDASARYFLRTQVFTPNKAIIQGFLGSVWEYYDTPRTTLTSIGTSSYALVKCTVGTTANGQWTISDGDWTGKFRVLIGVARSLSGSEEIAIEAWLTTRQA